MSRCPIKFSIISLEFEIQSGYGSRMPAGESWQSREWKIDTVMRNTAEFFKSYGWLKAVISRQQRGYELVQVVEKPQRMPGEFRNRISDDAEALAKLSGK